MQIIISPAKALDFEKPAVTNMRSDFRFVKEAKEITGELKNYMPKDLANLMKISPKLADLNYNRYQEWSFPVEQDKAKQALFAFNGEVYNGIQAETLNIQDVDFAQEKLRILSGLYGVLRPLDMILPYRLEMGIKLAFKDYKNLYDFWGSRITDMLNADSNEFKHKAMVNLASNEYFKSVKQELIKVPVISPEFKDLKNGQYKVISIYAKKARGLMTRFIIQNNITNPEDLRAFDLEGYIYNNQLSTELKPVFTRDH
ncbi:peroxide stress protein YaaA [Plebeiibacterium sediminum]|uniref:UPF0246 protein OM075_07325 n=1 Tax=Plebeiibacterium sediminum TaxID=2992112 RepID=A0AAE3SEI8_9BACT|nr:peroxide stress protein YaaA [Plebeiobacterium sediminum]MCW3786271.1 peroxide stress protein YaaA [Plebeiobacterium sediminum]